ncbi:transposase [Nitrosomonas sp.]|uniref:transposase n=1 Tax=Nitrosomonas sp. TaxID=42353 RepID=UPI0025EC27A0|nr:transposase [Nitrosomonas sp.]
MSRFMLSDKFWPKLMKILLQEAIYNKCNLRMTVEGVLYRMRVGCPWRNLLKAFGKWGEVQNHEYRLKNRNISDFIDNMLNSRPVPNQSSFNLLLNPKDSARTRFCLLQTHQRR